MKDYCGSYHLVCGDCNLLKTSFNIKRKQGLKQKRNIIKEERDIETRALIE